jgi:hypothetical protein
VRLLAIGNIRAAEFPHPYSQMSSGFLSDPVVIGEIDGADLPAEGVLAHKAFPHQKLDKGLPRDKQGERSATIRMRMLPGVG